ncbi:ROK family transcriptional regulator [Metabacillus idriensis]|uniref:ROK family transcriptional regulator n=1 Tax=Metabacillus idriensis TaxID=324768 RepID=UPI001748C861|nr:ROK family protein [Metabacillus idriensis]
MGLIGQNTSRTKKTNRSLVLQAIVRFGPTSRQKIAAFTQLTPATITNITSELINDGLVKELGDVEEKEKRAGRRFKALDLNGDSVHVIGVHIRSDKVELGIVNFKGHVIDLDMFKYSNEMNQQAFLALLIKELTLFIKRNEIYTITAIGIGTVGLVNFEQGKIINVQQIGWKEVNIVSSLSNEFSIPVFVDHNVRGMTLAEKMYGSCKEISDFLCIYIGQGIGAGLYLQEKLYRSDQTGALEFGHMTYEPGGIPCWCGNSGCIERYASEQAILSKLDMLSIEQVMENAENQDEIAIQTVKTAGSQIGVVLTSFSNMFHVQKIIIGGKLATEDLPLIQKIRDHVNTHSFLAKQRNIGIEGSVLKDQIGIVGAASIAILFGVIQNNDS